MTADPDRFPANVRAAVALLGGQTKAAARLGCRQATLSDYSRGVIGQPDDAIVSALASAVGVLPEVLLAGDVNAAIAAQRATLPS